MEYRSLRLALFLLSILAVFTADVFAATISGRCTIEGGSQKRVRLYISGRMKPFYTERDGTFSVDVPGPGSYTITPYPTGALVAAPLRATVTVGARDVTGINFTLTKLGETGLLRGRILNREGGPMVGTEVLLSPGGPLTTDANGIYIAAGLAAGRYGVTPLEDGFTFSPSVRSQRVAPGKIVSVSPKGRALPSGSTVETFFAGLFDATLQRQSGVCSVVPAQISGTAIVTQRDEKVRLYLPRLGTGTFMATTDRFGGAVNKLKLACRVTGEVEVRYGNRDSATVTGSVRAVCLGTEQCNATFRGTLARR
jgi:hypothetical protein